MNLNDQEKDMTSTSKLLADYEVQNTVLKNGKIVIERNCQGLWPVFSASDDANRITWYEATRLYDLPTAQELSDFVVICNSRDITIATGYWSSEENSDYPVYAKGVVSHYREITSHVKVTTMSVRSVEYMTDEQLINLLEVIKL